MEGVESSADGNDWNMTEFWIPDELGEDLDDAKVEHLTLRMRRLLLRGIPFAYHATRSKLHP